MNKEYNNILIDAVMHLGDLIHATTLIPLLKSRYPKARLTFLVPAGLASVLQLVEGVDDVIPYAYKSKGGHLNVVRMGKELRKYNFDLSISLDPRMRLTLMMLIARIPTRLGSRSVFGWKPDASRFFFTDFLWLPGFDCREHSMAYNFQYILKSFWQDFSYPFYQPCFCNPPSSAVQYVEKLIGAQKKGERIAFCVNTVDPARNWSPQKFAQVIDYALEQGAQAYIVGTQADKAVAQEVQAALAPGHQVQDLCGQTNFEQLLAFFQAVDLLVHVDNGMGHFAAAAGCKVLTLFTNSEPERFRPLTEKGEIVVSPVQCSTRCHELRKQCHKECLELLTVEMVVAKLEALRKA